MARAAAVDSDFIGELNADVSIGGTSAVLASTTGIDWGTSSTFAVQIGTDPETDAELVHVTRASATLTLASPSTTLTKAHTAGAPIYLVWSAEDANNKGNKDSTNTWTSAQTFQSTLLASSGSGTTTVYRLGAASCGIFGGSSQNRIGMKAGNLVVFDADANNGYVKIQNFPLKTEAGFSAGFYDLSAAAETAIYLSNGATQVVSDTTSATALTLDDDVSDAAVVTALAGGQVTIKDASANPTNGAGAGAGTNNIVITVAAAVGPIDSGTTVTINQDNGFVELTPADGYWLITGGIGFALS